jgi:flagellar hook-basal body complex protein FliE
MIIAPIGGQASQALAALRPIAPTGVSGVDGTQGTGQVDGEGFGKVITDAIDKVNQLQQQANDATVQVASGESSDLHSALLSVEEASLAMQLTLQVRNKLVESYQEIMRMPV